MIFLTTFFRNILQGISIIYTNNICAITSNVKTLDRFYCKERETLVDFSFTFQARTLQYFIILLMWFFFAIFILFATEK